MKRVLVKNPRTGRLPGFTARFIVYILLLCVGLYGLAESHQPVGAQSAVVFTLRIENVINPVKARVIERAVNRAAGADAELLVIGLDTPGGLYDSTRRS